MQAEPGAQAAGEVSADPTCICWTQWLRAHEERAADSAADKPPAQPSRPPLTVADVERMFEDL